MNDRKILVEMIEKIHTTPLGIIRIKRNIHLENIDVTSWCKEKIQDKNSIIKRVGKNYYVENDGYQITINATSYTIITVHILKKEKSSEVL